MLIALVGDIAFNDLISTNPEQNHLRYNLISKELKKYSLVFANLEVPVFASTFNEFKKQPHYADRDVTRSLLEMLNVRCVSLANNHIFDCKINGLKETISLLEELGIRYTGAGWKPEHVDPVIIKEDNCSIGFISYVDPSTNPKTELFNELFINYLDLDKIKSDISKIKNQVDFIICSLHWGVDYSFFPAQSQISQARFISNLGVDIIMGHHPHTLQPYEKHNKTFVFYSLGGITFGDYYKNGVWHGLPRKTKKSVIAIYDTNSKDFDFKSTKELKGNYVKVTKRNYIKKSKILWIHYKIKNSSKIFNAIYILYEKVIYRIFEYFFGFYQNPIKRMFQFRNIRKVSRLFK